MVRIFYLYVLLLCFSVSASFSQNTTLSEYNLITITNEFPSKNFEKRMDWSWRDSQRNYLFTYAPVTRLTDNSFAGVYIELISKVKKVKTILFLPAQKISKISKRDGLKNINRALERESNEVFDEYQASLQRLDKKMLKSYNVSLAAYLSRLATTIYVYQNQEVSKTNW